MTHYNSSESSTSSDYAYDREIFSFDIFGQAYLECVEITLSKDIENLSIETEKHHLVSHREVENLNDSLHSSASTITTITQFEDTSIENNYTKFSREQIVKIKSEENSIGKQFDTGKLEYPLSLNMHTVQTQRLDMQVEKFPTKQITELSMQMNLYSNTKSNNHSPVHNDYTSNESRTIKHSKISIISCNKLRNFQTRVKGLSKLFYITYISPCVLIPKSSENKGYYCEPDRFKSNHSTYVFLLKPETRVMLSIGFNNIIETCSVDMFFIELKFSNHNNDYLIVIEIFIHRLISVGKFYDIILTKRISLDNYRRYVEPYFQIGPVLKHLKIDRSSYNFGK